MSVSKKNRIILVLCGVVAGAVGWMFVAHQQDTIQDFFSTNGFSVPLPQTVSVVVGDGQFLQLVTEDGGSVKFTVTTVADEEGFSGRVQAERASLLSLYESVRPPYPEFLTNEIQCPEEFSPKQYEHERGWYMTAVVDERNNFGVCNSDLVFQEGSFGQFYCSERGVEIQVEMYGVPSPAAVMEEFACIKK